MVTREDLSPAQQAVQGMHAALVYAVKYKLRDPETLTLVFLSVKDEEHLEFLRDKLEWHDILVSSFREPDLDDALTAIAVHPYGERKLSKLPLALRGGEDSGREHVMVAGESSGSA